jgi:hypothetical protein
MSIIVSVKIHDGVVMAADSATTFYSSDGHPAQIYEHADKIVNLVKGLPIGVMTCGAGGVGNASIATLLKDLRDQLTDGGAEAAPLARDSYTVEEVATRVQTFFSDKAKSADFKSTLLLRLCGYSAARALPEVWEVVISGSGSAAPTCVQNETSIGPRWNGEPEALDRLILGHGSNFYREAVALELIAENDVETSTKLAGSLYEQLILPAAPIQDAIDLARFMVETTKGFVRFAVARVKSVGGPLELAAITKHEGFKWVQRKHFYESRLNLPKE